MKVWISDHAVERFIERVRPGLDEVEAREQLRMLIDMAEITPTPPEWSGAGVNFAASPAYAEISDGVAVALEPDGRERLVATTVLIRGGRDSRSRRMHKRRKAARKRRLREEREGKARTGHKAKLRALRNEGVLDGV